MRAIRKLAGTPRRRALALRRSVTNAREARQRIPWPVQPAAGRGVAIVSVNYNGLEHIARLLFSVFRVLDPQQLRRVVIVDNGSTDGSLPLLEAFAARGLIDLVRSDGPPYHGPGLNRGISFLASDEVATAALRYVWILDSDAIVLRGDALEASVGALQADGAPMAGQYLFGLDGIHEGYAHVASLLIDPAQIWRREIPPFQEHGDPGFAMQRHLHDTGVRILDFPFFSDEYMLHIGFGTLSSVVGRRDRRNRYYRFAVKHETEMRGMTHHFHGNPRGPQIFERFKELFRAEVPVLEPDALVEACLRRDRVSVAVD